MLQRSDRGTSARVRGLLKHHPISGENAKVLSSYHEEIYGLREGRCSKAWEALSRVIITKSSRLFASASDSMINVWIATVYTHIHYESTYASSQLPSWSHGLSVVAHSFCLMALPLRQKLQTRLAMLDILGAVETTSTKSSPLGVADCFFFTIRITGRIVVLSRFRPTPAALVLLPSNYSYRRP